MAEQQSTPPKSRRPNRRVRSDVEPVTVYLPRQVAEAARDAVIATTPYARGYRGLSALVSDAVSEKLARLQKQFNNGQPFPPRTVDLRRGRPLQ